MGDSEYSRPPELTDLVDLARRLNDAGAKYIVIGGMAMLNAGFVRATEDVDLLLKRGEENEKKDRLDRAFLEAKLGKKS